MPAGRFSPKIFPGARFGKLVVIRRIPGNKQHRAKVQCKCDCGNPSEPNADNLSGGKIKSCGCTQYDGLRLANKRKRKFEVGQKFGRLTIIEMKQARKNLVCLCTCGNQIFTRSDQVVRGEVQSCGCWNSEVRSKICIFRNKATAKFGGISSKYPRTYSSWNSMKNRCLNPNANAFSHYGGRGVKVCQGFQKDPRNIIRLIGVRTNSKPSLDRFPVHNGHYSCGDCLQCKKEGWNLNVRWTTKRGQCENRGSFNVLLTAFGKTRNKSWWMRKSGMSWSCLTGRLRRGWPMEKAVMTPDPKGNCYKP